MNNLNGGARGGRTPDLLNAIQALSQLSYGPISYDLYGIVIARLNHLPHHHPPYVLLK